MRFISYIFTDYIHIYILVFDPLPFGITVTLVIAEIHCVFFLKPCLTSSSPSVRRDKRWLIADTPGTQTFGGLARCFSTFFLGIGFRFTPLVWGVYKCYTWIFQIYVKFLPFGEFFWAKRHKFYTQKEDPGNVDRFFSREILPTNGLAWWFGLVGGFLALESVGCPIFGTKFLNHFRGSGGNPNYRAPNHQFTIVMGILATPPKAIPPQEIRPY